MKKLMDFDNRYAKESSWKAYEYQKQNLSWPGAHPFGWNLPGAGPWQYTLLHGMLLYCDIDDAAFHSCDPALYIFNLDHVDVSAVFS